MQPSTGSVFIELLPLIIGAAVVPVPIMIVLLLLSNRGGLAKGAAFVAGAILVRLAQGIAFGWIFAGDPAATTEAGGNLIVSTLLIVIGVLMLINAFKKWTKEADPDEPPPKWMASLGNLSALMAFGMGVAVVLLSGKQWVFTLGAIGVLEKAHFGPPTSAGLFLSYVLGAQVFGLVAVIASVLSPERANRAIFAVRTWLERNSRPVFIAVYLVFGLFFLYKGISALIG